MRACTHPSRSRHVRASAFARGGSFCSRASMPARQAVSRGRLGERPDDARRSPVPRGRLRTGGTSAAGPRTALVVDDDAAMQTLLRRVVEGLGHAARAASSGSDALQAIRSERPALIVLDLGLPDIDGLDFLRAVRAKD